MTDLSRQLRVSADWIAALQRTEAAHPRLGIGRRAVRIEQADAKPPPQTVVVPRASPHEQPDPGEFIEQLRQRAAAVAQQEPAALLALKALAEGWVPGFGATAESSCESPTIVCSAVVAKSAES